MALGFLFIYFSNNNNVLLIAIYLRIRFYVNCDGSSYDFLFIDAGWYSLMERTNWHFKKKHKQNTALLRIVLLTYYSDVRICFVTSPLFQILLIAV